MDPNKDEIKIVIETSGQIDPHALWINQTKPPKGVTVVPTTKGDVTTIVITIAPLALEFGKDMATTALFEAASQWAQEWLVDFIAKLKAKRVHIVNEHKPKEINRVAEWERKQFWMKLQPSRKDVRRARSTRLRPKPPWQTN